MNDANKYLVTMLGQSYLFTPMFLSCTYPRLLRLWYTSRSSGLRRREWLLTIIQVQQKGYNAVEKVQTSSVSNVNKGRLIIDC